MAEVGVHNIDRMPEHVRRHREELLEDPEGGRLRNRDVVQPEARYFISNSASFGDHEVELNRWMAAWLERSEEVERDVLASAPLLRGEIDKEFHGPREAEWKASLLLIRDAD